MYRVAEVELEKDTRIVERWFSPSFVFNENNVISCASLWAYVDVHFHLKINTKTYKYIFQQRVRQSFSQLVHWTAALNSHSKSFFYYVNGWTMRVLYGAQIITK